MVNSSTKNNYIENELKINYIGELESAITGDLVVRKEGSIWDRDMQKGIGVKVTTLLLGNSQSELMYEGCIADTPMYLWNGKCFN